MQDVGDTFADIMRMTAVAPLVIAAGGGIVLQFLSGLQFGSVEAVLTAASCASEGTNAPSLSGAYMIATWF